MKKVLSILILKFLMVSCGSTDTVDSKDVNEDRMYRDYRFTFKDLTKEIYACVQFRMGGSTGTTVRLSEGTKVALNDFQLNVHDGADDFYPINGTYYKASLDKMDIERDYKFLWTRRDSKTFQTVLDVTKGILTTDVAPNSRIRNDQPLTIRVTAGPIAAYETISYYIKGLNRSYESETVSSGEQRDLTYTFPSTKLKNYIGDASIWVVRTTKKSTSNSDEDIGGQVATERWSSPVAVSFSSSNN